MQVGREARPTCAPIGFPMASLLLQSEAQILSARSLLGPYARLISTSEPHGCCLGSVQHGSMVEVTCTCHHGVACHGIALAAPPLTLAPCACTLLAVCHNGTVLRAGNTAEKRLRASAMLALTKLMIVRSAACTSALLAHAS